MEIEEEHTKINKSRYEELKLYWNIKNWDKESLYKESYFESIELKTRMGTLKPRFYYEKLLGTINKDLPRSTEECINQTFELNNYPSPSLSILTKPVNKDNEHRVRANLRAYVEDWFANWKLKYGEILYVSAWPDRKFVKTSDEKDENLKNAESSGNYVFRYGKTSNSIVRRDSMGLIMEEKQKFFKLLWNYITYVIINRERELEDINVQEIEHTSGLLFIKEFLGKIDRSGILQHIMHLVKINHNTNFQKLDRKLSKQGIRFVLYPFIRRMHFMQEDVRKWLKFKRQINSI